MTDYREQIPELREAIDALHIVDTHEHLPINENARDQHSDVLEEYLYHYFNRDLLSAGLPLADYRAVIDSEKPLMERWKLVEPYWEACRLTGYGRSLDIAAMGIYGIDGVRGSTLQQLNDAFTAAREKGGHYKRVLKDLCRIRTSVVDFYPQGDIARVDRDFFSISYNIGSLVSPGSINGMVTMADAAGAKPRSLQDWLDICESSVDNAVKGGATSLKCAMAYDRPLYFPRSSYAQAEECWNAVRSNKHLTYWNSDRVYAGEAFENYAMHHILRIAERRGLPIQFHTGLQEGSGNTLANSNPLLLTNLLLEYTGLRFDLFHIGYPFTGEIGAMCKNFPNAYIDMCWAHIISPRACMLALDEWLDAVPYSKISAFGGDYCFVDGVYGHQTLARENVCKTLSRKVLAGEMTTDKAIDIAKALFHDNPMRILNLA